MAQKEDILEQIVEEYLTHNGYFVQHNIKYKPDKAADGYNARQDSVHSDIDVLAYNPLKRGPKRVLAFNIKSWQGGFNFKEVLKQISENKKISGRESRLRYRELCIPKWSRAFIKAVRDRTGTSSFTYVLAVTLAKGEKKLWTESPILVGVLGDNPLKVLTLKDMVEAIEKTLKGTLAATDIGRTLQLFRAAGLRPKPTKPELSVESGDDP